MDFLAHLIRHERVSEEQATDALALQQKSGATIGQVALRFKLLTVKQTFEVMRMQIETKEPFGSIAVQLGYLNEGEVERVLAAHQEETPSIGTILVQIGALTGEQLDAAQHDFEREPGRARAVVAPTPQRDRLASCNDPRPPSRTCKVA